MIENSINKNYDSYACIMDLRMNHKQELMAIANEKYLLINWHTRDKRNIKITAEDVEWFVIMLVLKRTGRKLDRYEFYASNESTVPAVIQRALQPDLTCLLTKMYNAINLHENYLIEMETRLVFDRVNIKETLDRALIGIFGVECFKNNSIKLKNLYIYLHIMSYIISKLIDRGEWEFANELAEVVALTSPNSAVLTSDQQSANINDDDDTNNDDTNDDDTNNDDTNNDDTNNDDTDDNNGLIRFLLIMIYVGVAVSLTLKLGKYFKII